MEQIAGNPRKMRRKDREILDQAEIESIIQAADVCRLAMSKEGHPYLVPMCFGYRRNVLYFHSAKDGKKLKILRENNEVCFEMDIDHELIRADQPCSSEMKYRSVIGFGRACFVEDIVEKKQALDIITRHYSEGDNKASFAYSSQNLAKTVIIKVEIDRVTGKKFEG